MSTLREALDQVAADVPVYGDLDRAIEKVDRDRRRRHGLVAGLAAAAAVVVVVVGVLVVTRGSEAPERPVGPTTPSSTTSTRTQSSQTWTDTPLAATGDGADWVVPDPLQRSRDRWFAVVTDHLDPPGADLDRQSSDAWGGHFIWPAELPDYPTYGRIGLIVDRGAVNLLDDGCRAVRAPNPSNGTPSCTFERFVAPGGEPAAVSSWGRRCGAYEGGPPPDSCGDYVVGVAVRRGDGLVGLVEIEGRGTPDSNPFSRTAMAAAAADPRLSLPASAFGVPSDAAVLRVVGDHVARYRPDDHYADPHHPGYAQAFGSVQRGGKPKPRALGVSVRVWPAGDEPSCGPHSLVECLERRVYGAEDPTTVFVGEWDEDDWASCCPKNSRAWRREFVYVGAHNTVLATESRIVGADEQAPGDQLDQSMIDLVLDPRLQ
ncbi:hypothetical protein [Nocardioides luteus]|uniref:Uncharacterized protein n=1 Tax=Nocardioides luteus TaxID=1844 RepID=A0A1J4N0Z7_9ACTN|nr:hypothetical protein [Nocardioides luteus]OIJ25261.1 hypothetical protein UG56_018695 [Nocardioides luteus]